MERRVRNAFLHADQRRQMDDRVRPLRGHQRREGPGRRDVELVQGKPGRMQGGAQILAAAGAEIVNPDHGLSLGQQEVRRVTADETGRTGDKNLGHGGQ